MKTTLIYKQADLILQLLAILIPLAGSLFGTMHLVTVYFAAGIAQMLSYLINVVYLDKFMKNRDRVYYGCCLLFMLIATAATCFLLCFDDGLYLIFISLFFVGCPLLGLWYIGITIAEARSIKRIVHRRDDMLWS